MANNTDTATYCQCCLKRSILYSQAKRTQNKTYTCCSILRRTDTVLPAYNYLLLLFLVLTYSISVSSALQIPSFQELKAQYPGYAHFGGRYYNKRLIEHIGCSKELLLHDTSALRLSTAFNSIGGKHSLGKELIRLSKYGRDSVTGRDGLQYIYHPIAYGPFLADKYGYPTVSKLHQQDPLNTKKNFWGRQGILRVITYTHRQNLPKGHVALWDCDHFHQSHDWIAENSLITVEFWEAPDSSCSPEVKSKAPTYPPLLSLIAKVHPGGKPAGLRHHHWEKKFIKKYYQLHKTLKADQLPIFKHKSRQL